ncbi:eRF1, BTB, and Kelch domain containing protein [Sarcoptes scabiei]|uniref:ERF1, BTB, and Kelch domain containing protein n=1 Tax=Sarcoptes scabiei TaxID=52283 RepID=A0A132ABJ5_SARSC|nr:eRF1, BTB, and Kelch domain containing protein [Sarcoptes scabiei]
MEIEDHFEASESNIDDFRSSSNLNLNIIDTGQSPSSSAITPDEMRTLSNSDVFFDSDTMDAYDGSTSNENSISSGLQWCVSKNLANMYQMRPKLCDVCLSTDDGTKIYAHRVILSSSMHYFSAMFIGSDYSFESSSEHRLDLSYSVNFSEQNQYTISIKNVDGPSLNEIIRYCYLGKVQIDQSNVQSLLSAATMLNCGDVVKICSNFLRSQLQISNASGIFSLAKFMGCQELKDFSFFFILNNFVQISGTEEFAELSMENFSEIISSDYIDTGKEGEPAVLNALIYWLSHNFEHRKQFYPELLKQIRFPQFNQFDLLTIEQDYGSMINDEPSSKNLIIEALKYHLVKDTCDFEKYLTSNQLDETDSSHYDRTLSKNVFVNLFDLSLPRFRERIPKSRRQCLIVIGGQAPKAICQCEYFDFGAEKWSEFVCNLPSRRCRSGIVVLDGFIYAIGGFNGQCRVRSVDMFDPKRNQWIQCPDLEVERSTLGACVLDGLIYAVGGFDGTLGHQSAEVYDPIARQWSFIAPMKTRRSSVAVVALNGLLYAIGGYDGSSRQCLSSVECFSPKTQRWTRVADMSQRRSGACVEVLSGRIYAIGGHDGPTIRKSVECYDPSTNTWSQCADMIYARRNAVVVTRDHCLYVVGGEDGQTNLKSVEIYDPETNSWSLFPNEMRIEKEDIWHVYNLIQEGDTIRASTMRKIITESATGSTGANKVRTTLTISVESIDYDFEACMLRVKGKNVEENQYVKMGQYHTIDIELNRKFTLSKQEWDVYALERLDLASDPAKSADLGAVIMNEGIAHICLVTESMTLVRSKIDVHVPRKSKGHCEQHEKGLRKFFDQVLQSILRHINFEVIKCLLIASPGFVKDQFYQYIMEQAIKTDNKIILENKSKIVLCHASSGFKHSLKEILSDPLLQNRLADTKAAKEMKVLQDFQRMLHHDPSRACYGLKHVEKAIEMQSVETFLISDRLFRNVDYLKRKHYIELVEKVREQGGDVKIFSSLHVSGELCNKAND